jgi:uncharacterized protein YwqG
MTTTPMILISRRSREVGMDWSNARSWFGGAPRLGGADWPRGHEGKALHFVAQIDFAEIAAKADNSPLPKQGSLAFFIGKTVFVADPDIAPPTLPPLDTPDLTTSGASAEWPHDREGRALFPYWPVDFTLLNIEVPKGLDEDDLHEAQALAQKRAIEKHFVRREYNFSPDLAFSGPPIPNWWRCAHFLSDKLDEAVKNAPKVLQTDEHMLVYAQGKLDEARRENAAAPAAPIAKAGPTSGLGRLLGTFGPKKVAPPTADGKARLAAEAIKKAEATVTLYENKIAKLHRVLPGLQAFAAEVADWSRERDPWSLMGTDDWAQLGRYWTRLTEFPEYTVHYGVTPLDYLKTQMFLTLPQVDTPAYATLPTGVRDVIAGRRAPHPQWWGTVMHFAEDLRKVRERPTPSALNGKREKLAANPEKAAELAEFDGKAAAFHSLATELSAWTEGRDPLHPLSDEESAELSQKLARLAELREIASAYHIKSLLELEKATLVGLATAEDAHYATLPEHVRMLINREYLLPISIPHQIFGQPAFIQGDSAAQAEAGKLLLLQLGYDDMMFWSFGDNGVYQFWISPEDLAQPNWDAVTMTFECH